MIKLLKVGQLVSTSLKWYFVLKLIKGEVSATHPYLMSLLSVGRIYVKLRQREYVKFLLMHKLCRDVRRYAYYQLDFSI